MYIYIYIYMYMYIYIIYTYNLHDQYIRKKSAKTQCPTNYFFLQEFDNLLEYII